MCFCQNVQRPSTQITHIIQSIGNLMMKQYRYPYRVLEILLYVNKTRIGPLLTMLESRTEASKMTEWV